MSLRTSLTVPLALLAGIHVIVVMAGFFSTYDPASQDREAPNTPPTRVHWLGTDGQFRLRPFVYASAPCQQTDFETRPQPCAAVVDAMYPIQFLPHGAQYRIFGWWIADRHLLGVAAPAHLYLMGTDNYGRDVFSRLLYGGQISLFAGLLATALSLCMGLILGTLAGFYGGWSDAVIMRGAELFLALPWLYLLLALRAFLPLNTGPRQTFILLIAVIGLLGWARPARLVRGIVLSTKERAHILAARGFGASDIYLLRRHVLPETRSVILAQASLLIPQYVLAEVTLSFLGLGVNEPIPSWGVMLAALQQYHVLVSDWWMFFPGLLLVLVFLSYGALSTALQENIPKVGVGWNEYS